jgi:type I restriction enzyme S subunit
MRGSRHAEYLARLPDNWERVPLAELGELVGGGTPSRGNPAFWNGDIPWVTPGEITDLNGCKWLLRTRDKITQAGLQASAAKLLPANSVLITTRATIGAVALAGLSVSTNQGFRSLVPSQSADPEFYFHLLTWIAPEFKRLGCGSTFDEISRADLGNIVVPRPPKEQQEGIAAVLDAADRAIEGASSRIDKLMVLRVGLAQDLLTRGLGDDGHLRCPEMDEFVDSPLGAIPKSWRVGSLEEVIDPDRPVVYGILMPGAGYDGPSGVPVVKVKDIIDGEVLSDGLLLTSPEIDREYRRSRLEPGDLLFTIRGTVGRMAFVPDRLDGANITQDTARLAVADANPVYVREWLDSLHARSFIDLNTIGQAVRGINLSDLRRLPIALPPPDEQDMIAAVVAASGRVIRAERKRLAKLRAVKRALAEALLSGRVTAAPSPSMAAAVATGAV